MAEIELFCEGTTIFCVTNRLENSTTAWVTSEEPPKFTVDGYPRDYGFGSFSCRGAISLSLFYLALWAVALPGKNSYFLRVVPIPHRCLVIKAELYGGVTMYKPPGDRSSDCQSVEVVPGSRVCVAS
ncbi:hypothetical protein B0H14DRAFT_2570523 [Mycena olivaceomarginata]|nr:hypothetical protein B0H14DRAFT_2570523 [Mycena olivaceomarginata]